LGNGCHGPVRVMFSFFLGVIIQRIVPRSPARSHLIGPFCAAFLIVLFALRPGAWTGLYHLICVLLIFPALGVLAMRIDVDGVGALVFKKLGDASYGIYVLHMPTLILVSWIASHSGGSAGPRGPAIFLVSCSLLFTVVLALDRWFDRPARFWMTRRMGLEFKRANLAAPPI